MDPQNDKRYLVFDHVPEQRERWLRVCIVMPLRPLTQLILFVSELLIATVSAYVIRSCPRKAVIPKYEGTFLCIRRFHCSLLFAARLLAEPRPLRLWCVVHLT